ncbi:uncharacterized protein LOC110118018 [Ceratitis capitata]|uniref:uncharacterized protein LOC110118018 n=1 Tax=Ceratitis capitata TaxID=7213 RepID=UPI000A0FFA87|nr:uncharacterized protein LOC110118018 [Ceratitis capitata]
MAQRASERNGMEFSTTYAYTFKQKRSSLCMHRLKPQLVVGGQQQHHHQRHHPLHNKPREVTQKSTNECKLAGNECGAVISEKHSSVDREQGKRNILISAKAWNGMNVSEDIFHKIAKIGYDLTALRN